MKKVIIFILLLIPNVVNASSMIAYDMDTKQILYSNNIHETRPVASISKIMTAILACESGKLDDVVTIGDEINKAYGSGIYIRVGEEMTLRDLVYGLMLRSGNDAAFSIAKYVGGTVDNFVEMMNEKAHMLGMNDSIYNNPNGLDDKGGNISSTYDMAILTSYAMKNEDYRTITSTRKHTVKTNMNYYSWINKNKLLYMYKYTTGGKTGYTKIAKRTLVTTASNNNMNLVIVTLNDGNDFNDHMNMYKKLFDEYNGYDILIPGDISIVNLKDNKSYYINSGFKYDMKNDMSNITVKFKPSENTKNIAGKVYVYYHNEELYNTDVYVNINKKVTFLQKLKNIFRKRNNVQYD